MQAPQASVPILVQHAYRVVEEDVDRLAILFVDGGRQGLARGEVRHLERDLVIRGNLVVVGRVLEREGKHTLLLQVRLCAEPGFEKSMIIGNKNSKLTMEPTEQMAYSAVFVTRRHATILRRLDNPRFTMRASHKHSTHTYTQP